jgi:3-oxoacyl-[acyl-carrier protein] reductase
MKSILLTGDSKGVGLGILTTLLAKTDYRIVGISRSFSDENKAIQQEYQNRYIHHDFDMVNSSNVKSFYLKVLKKEGPFHGFINNAAFAYDDIVTNLNVISLERMYHINVFSPMMLTKYILRDMLLHKTKGSIIHISSVSVHTGYKGLSMYASTKGALEAFSKNTAREWGSLGIRSNVVCPGFMETNMSANLSSKQKDRIYQRTSLKEPTSIESVAETVCFLLGKESKSITGQVIHVDNGTI